MEDIKKSFRKLAYIYHPDRSTNGGKYKNELLQIFEAYSVLSNKEKRREYDLHLSINADSMTAVDIVKSDKELVIVLSNIQFFLTYPNISPKTILFYNNKIIKLVNNNSLELLVNQQTRKTDPSYVNLMLGIVKLLNHEAFLVFYTYLKEHIEDDYLKQLNHIKKSKLLSFYYDKHFNTLLIIITLLICLGLFYLVKK